MAFKPPKMTSTDVREWLQILIIIAAGIWGAYTFIYKEIIVPSRLPASLDVTSEMDALGQKDGFVLVRVRVHIQNTKDIKVYSPALWFTVYGLNFDGMNTPAENNGTMQITPLSVERSKYSSKTEMVVAAWRLENWEVWYQPGDETFNEHLFYIPENRYQAIQLKLEYMVIKNIDQISTVSWADQAGIFTPTLMLKGADNTDVPFASNNPDQALWVEDAGLSYNWYTTTLSLLENKQPLSDTPAITTP